MNAYEIVIVILSCILILSGMEVMAQWRAACLLKDEVGHLRRMLNSAEEHNKKLVDSIWLQRHDELVDDATGIELSNGRSPLEKGDA